MKRAILLLLLAAGAVLALDLPCGVPVDGYLREPEYPIDDFNPKYTTDVYTVQNEAGDAILIRVQNLERSDSNFLPRIIVRDPGAAEIAPQNSRVGGYSKLVAGGTTSSAEYALAFTGPYNIEVGATSKIAGRYRIVLIRLNRACASAVLSCGVSASGQVSGDLSVRTYQVLTRPNDTTSFRWVKTGPFASTNPGPNPPPAPLETNVRIFVFGPDGVLLPQTSGAYFSEQGASRRNRFQIDVQNAAGGLLTAVIFDAASNTASFSISATRLNGACGVPPLICGTPIDSNLKAPASVDGYVVSAQAGDVYAVRLARSDTSGQFQPVGEVYDPSGKLLASINSTQSSPHSVAVGTFTAAATGTYTVLAADSYDSTKTGNYTITLTRLNRPCSTAAIDCGSLLDAKLSGLLRSNTYTLTAAANDTFLLRVFNSSDNRSFKPKVDVYDPQGSVVQTVNSFDIARMNFTVPAAGVYTVVVSDSYDGGQAGSYTLSAYRVNRPCGAGSIDCGKPTAGSIDGPMRYAVFTYPASAGESFSVRVLNPGGGAIQPEIEIYDPSGFKVGSDVSGTGKSLDISKPVAGAYTIVALDSSSPPRQGTFAIELLRTKNACGTSPAKGQSVTGVIAGTAPFVSYSMPVSAGDVFSARSSSFTSGFSALMEVFDQDGVRVDQGTYSITRRVPTSGTYTVVVGASDLNGAGGYGFSWQLLNDPANAASLLCGSTVSGSLAPSTAYRYYLAGLNASDTGKFLLTRTSDNFSPVMEIYDPAGARVSSNSNEISQRVSRTGNYLVVVSPETSAGQTGTFSVSLQRPNNPCNTAVLTCGQSALRYVDLAGQIDAFRFTGAAGDQTIIRLPGRTGTYAPFGELYNESGSLVRGFSSGTLNMLLPANGTYTLFVRDRNGAGTGSYRVSLQTDPACTVEDSQAPSISLVRPTGGEVIAGGATFRIAWQSDDNVDVAAHEIGLSTDGGKTFPTVIGGTLSGVAQSYEWSVPGTIAPTRTAVVRVTATDAAGNSKSAASDLLAVIGSGFAENSSAKITYDPLGRVAEVVYSDGRTVSYTWDAQGNLVRVSVTGQ
jgi:YD repeat-containing protein